MLLLRVPLEIQNPSPRERMYDPTIVSVLCKSVYYIKVCGFVIQYQCQDDRYKLLQDSQRSNKFSVSLNKIVCVYKNNLVQITQIIYIMQIMKLNYNSCSLMAWFLKISMGGVHLAD